MELPKDLSWEITTNENGVEMITMPKFKMNEIVEYLKYADTELKKLRVADVIKNEVAVCEHHKTCCYPRDSGETCLPQKGCFE